MGMPGDQETLPPDIAFAHAYTLVVGAGVNASRRVPGWQALVEAAWGKINRDPQDEYSSRAARLDEARDAVQRHCDWSKEQARELVFSTHPFEPQFALELLNERISSDEKLADEIRDLIASAGPMHISVSAATIMPLLLAFLLYKDMRREGLPDTLSELADFVRSRASVKRVISLNVDNLFEIEVNNFGRLNTSQPFLEVISRQRHTPGFGVPTYHLHGFLPINVFKNIPAWATVNREFVAAGTTSQTLEHMTEPVPESFIFTDLQYWESFSRPLSFANFIFANALHDSSCIFIGLSMTDLNIIRWLGLNAVEFRSECAREDSMMEWQFGGPRSPYRRHCWITSRASDPSGIISALLARRGIYTHVIPNWSPDHVGSILGQLS